MKKKLNSRIVTVPTTSVAPTTKTTAITLLVVGLGLAIIGTVMIASPALTSVQCKSAAGPTLGAIADKSRGKALNQQLRQARAEYARAGLGKILKKGKFLAAAEARKQYLLQLAATDPNAARHFLFTAQEIKKLNDVSDNCSEAAIKVEGKFGEVHGDNLDGEETFSQSYLKTGKDELVLYGTETSGEPLENGTVVEVDGYQIDNSLISKLEISGSVSQAAITVVAPQAVITPTSRNVLILAGDFSNTDFRNPDLATIEGTAANTNSYYQENSYDLMHWNFITPDWIEVPVARGNTCPYQQFAQQLVAQADPQVDFSQMNNQSLAVLVPFKKYGTGIDESTDASCAWDGLAWPFPITFQTNEGAVSLNVVWAKVPLGLEYVLNHELGHSIGVNHAYWANCPPGKIFFDSSCTHEEYGDSYDVMGGRYTTRGMAFSRGHFSGERKKIVGWLEPDQYVTINNHDPGRTVTLTPLEQPGGLKLLRIQRDTYQYLTVEYRQPTLADGVTQNTDGSMYSSELPEVFNGALVKTFNGNTSYLIDTSPNPTNDPADTVLHLGQSLTDPKSGSTITVNAINSSGVTVTVTSPDIDYYNPPTPGVINDGSGADIDTSSDTSTFAANWEPVTDVGKGLDHYEYQIDTINENVYPLTNNGLNTSFSVSGLNLTPGETYFVHVQAIDRAGNSSYFGSSDGVTINKVWPGPASSLTTGDTPAPPDCISDGLDISTDDVAINNTEVLMAIWCDSPDVDTINRYQYAIGTSNGGTDIVGFTDIGKATNLSRTGLAMQEGQTYFISVRSVDNSNIAGPAISTDGVLVDLTPPGPTDQVNDGPSADIDVQGSLLSLRANWLPVSDPSGVRYQYSFGSTPGGSEVQSFVSRSITNVTLNNLSLSNGTTYYATVRAIDLAGNVGPAVTSDGVLVNPASDPVLPVVAVTAPADGATLKGYVTINVSATDNAAVDYVQIKIDGQDFGSRLTDPPYNAYWWTNGVDDGPHTITAIASDGVNIQTSATVSVTVANTPGIDDEPPTVSIALPNEGQTISGTYTLYAGAFDESAVSTVTFYVDGVAVATVPPYVSSFFTYRWNSQLVSNGTHTVYAVATDVLGNSGISAVRNFVVNNPDFIPPSTINDLRAL